jgi:cytoplasmic tRNA 2-thiolation protein 2
MACNSGGCDGGGGGGGGGCGGAYACGNPAANPTGVDPKGGARQCVKCKEQNAVLAVGNQSEPICANCLHVSLLAKFKTAVNNNGLVLPSDKVLVAFSGGPASR